MATVDAATATKIAANSHLAGSASPLLPMFKPANAYILSLPDPLTTKTSPVTPARAGVSVAKVRIHLDVQVDDIATARKQAESLGGRWSGERHHYDEGVVMVMHDPEEHEFCLVQYYR